MDSGNLFIKKLKRGCGNNKPGNVDLILTSYKHMRYDAINVSQVDLALGVPFLVKKAKAMDLPFLSSNLVDNKGGKTVFYPFIIRKIDGVRVGIFGLMDTPMDPIKLGRYAVRNPDDTAREVLNSLKGKVDLVILLSSLSNKKNVRLLRDLSGIDFIITTDKRNHAPTRVKQAYMLSPGNRGRYLGRLDITLSSLKRPFGFKDISRKDTVKRNLDWTERRIIQLKDKKGDILKSANDRIKEKFARELERLEKQKVRYQKRLAELEHNSCNYFDCRIIPLAARGPERDIMVSRRGKKRPGMIYQYAGSVPHIRVNTLHDDKGKRITFVLVIDKAPNQVRALGLDVAYDPKVLHYSTYAKGDLVKAFDMFDVSKLKEGLLRMGGFEAREDFISAGKRGELVRLNFQLIGKGNLDLRLINLKDDISSWKVEGYTIESLKNKAQLKKIQESVKEKGTKWKAGHTSVSDLTSQEKKKRLGLKK